LTETDRVPWLSSVRMAALTAAISNHDGVVVACSCLRRIYREGFREMGKVECVQNKYLLTSIVGFMSQSRKARDFLSSRTDWHLLAKQSYCLDLILSCYFMAPPFQSKIRYTAPSANHLVTLIHLFFHITDSWSFCFVVVCMYRVMHLIYSLNSQPSVISHCFLSRWTKKLCSSNSHGNCFLKTSLASPVIGSTREWLYRSRLA